ncbi:MAG: hypothetical protein ACUVXF_04425 [Desulfobaccales bacterium]
MASEKAGLGGQLLAEVLQFLRIALVNSWRRLLILGRYLILLLHHLRLRRAWPRLGKRVHLAFEGGEVNPMLAGEVKDSLSAAQALQAQKNRQLEAIAALRQKIRSSRGGEAPSPPEAEAAPEAAMTQPTEADPSGECGPTQAEP